MFSFYEFGSCPPDSFQTFGTEKKVSRFIFWGSPNGLHLIKTLWLMRFVYLSLCRLKVFTTYKWPINPQKGGIVESNICKSAGLQNDSWKKPWNHKTAQFFFFLYLIWKFNLLSVVFKGRSINIKSAGIIGRNGPQSKQPFLVAFFKASGVLLRSVRAAGGKKKNQNRNKSSNQPESSRALKPGGIWTSVPDVIISYAKFIATITGQIAEMVWNLKIASNIRARFSGYFEQQFRLEHKILKYRIASQRIECYRSIRVCFEIIRLICTTIKGLCWKSPHPRKLPNSLSEESNVCICCNIMSLIFSVNDLDPLILFIQRSVYRSACQYTVCAERGAWPQPCEPHWAAHQSSII